jgi:HmuY protein
VGATEEETAMHLRLRTIWLSVMLLMAAQACAAKLKPRKDEMPRDAGALDAGDLDPNAVLDGGIPVRTGKFKNTGRSDGSLVSVVDATDMNEWQQFDLDTGTAVEGDSGWDLAFTRFRIKTNGGVTGKGGVYVVALEGQSFDALEKSPNMGFAADRVDSVGDAGDADMDPDNVFNSGDADWYDYNVMTHELSPKDITYVFASTEKRFFKFRIEQYYDSAGTPAKFKFHWKQIEPPDSGFPPGDGGAGE